MVARVRVMGCMLLIPPYQTVAPFGGSARRRALVSGPPEGRGWGVWGWWARRESNPHLPFGSTDFKSDVSAVPPLARVAPLCGVWFY